MRLLTLLLLFSFGLLSAQSLDRQIEKLDTYIDQARLQWEVPGLSVAIVKDSKVLFSKGYGLRKLGESKPVNGKTLFAICSTTKAMTAAAIGMLVDEGKVDWDDRVVKHMPDFQLHDPYVSREVRVRDLLTHNAGLGNADLLWSVWKYEPQEILHRMRKLEPSYSFRAGYTYQNIMYAAAGELIHRISGKAWGEFLQERIFDPLGMKHSFPYKSMAESQDNRSTPHHLVEGKITPIRDSDADPIGPAGSVWSCADDMAIWMRFLLDSTKVGENRLLQADTYAELFRPQILIPQEQFYPTAELTNPHWTSYGLGWFQHDYAGEYVDFHTGSLAGTVAILGLLRKEGVGVYVFGNLDHAEVRHAIMYKVFDVLGETGIDRDWSSDFMSLYSEREQQQEQRLQSWYDQRVEDTSPTLALEDYQGVYSDEFLGEVPVLLENGTLEAQLGVNILTLSHWHYNTFRGKWIDRPWVRDSFLSFEIDENGEPGLLWAGRRFRKKD